MIQAVQKAVTRVCWTRDRYIAAYRAGVLPEKAELIAGDMGIWENRLFNIDR